MLGYIRKNDAMNVADAMKINYWLAIFIFYGYAGDK